MIQRQLNTIPAWAHSQPSPLFHTLGGGLSGPIADFIHAPSRQQWREGKNAYTFPFYGLVSLIYWDAAAARIRGEAMQLLSVEWEIQGHMHTKTQTPYASQDERE